MNTQKMKAIVCTKYGSPDYLQLQEVAKPVPQDNEVLVKVFATTVTAADSMMRRADPFISRFFLGLFKPKKAIMGTGFAGKIEAIGKSVKNYKVGDEVFGETSVNFGANAEYVCLPEDGIFLPKPATLSYEEAATFSDGPLTSFNFLKNLGKIKKGQRVLINGASGSLGTAAVQLAKYYGAEVTGICSTRNLEMVRALGANKVIDYTTTDFTKTQQTYDLIYDTVGKLSFSTCKGSLTPDGIYLSPVLNLGLLFQMLWTSKIGSKKAIFSATGLRPGSELKSFLKKLINIVEKGGLKSVIDKRYPLEQTAEGHRYVDSGRKRGNVVIQL